MRPQGITDVEIAAMKDRAMGFLIVGVRVMVPACQLLFATIAGEMAS